MELISTVKRKTASGEDFAIGKQRSRNVWEPIAFTQVITAAVKGRENAVFVEIAPKRGLQRNIKEILSGEIQTFPSLKPIKEYETLFDLVKSLSEFGYNHNWPSFYEGLKTILPGYLKCQFEHKYLKTYLKSPSVVEQNCLLQHPLIVVPKTAQIFTCFITQDRTPNVVF